MIALRALCVAAFAVAGCASKPAGLGSSSAPAASPAPEKRNSKPEGFWSDTIRPIATLSRGWNRIPGRAGTGCAHDSAFAFRVRPGLPDKVLIFLNGGGACWRAQDCDPKGRPTYTMTADSANDAAARTGILDTGNEKNPVRDYTMVFVPYCTGDVHLGTRESEYEYVPAKGGSRVFAVRHGGAANLEAVLDWVYANVKTPKNIFVAGSSAGAIPSPVVAEKVARHYPRAQIAQLGDAAGGYQADGVASNFWQWGASEYLQRDPVFRNLDSASFTNERLYLSSAQIARRIHFAQYNAVEDATQLVFLSMLGVKATSLRPLLAANLEQLSSDMPWFHSYTAPGRVHTILRSNAMYALKVEGVPFTDWLAALVEGEEVSDVGTALLKAPAKK